MLILVAFAAGVLLSSFAFRNNNTQIKPVSAAAPVVMEKIVVELPVEPVIPELTRANLLNEITSQGIVCPNVVFAQAEIESAFLKAGSSPKTRNLFGMRYPSTRKTTAIGLYLQGKDSIIYGTRAELRPYLSRPTYAVYANWVDAVEDYKLWQDYSFKTKEKYLEFLQRVYATEPTYAATLKKMVN